MEWCNGDDDEDVGFRIDADDDDELWWLSDDLLGDEFLLLFEDPVAAWG